MAFAGCSSLGESKALQLAPSQSDWDAAFLRLSPAERTLLVSKPVLFDLSAGPFDETVYDIIDGHGSDHVDHDEHLNIEAVCDGFNQRFGKAGAKRWQIIGTATFTGVSTPSGISTDRFDLEWTFRDSTGREVAISATEFGPGVKIIWGTSPKALALEINQAFALTFLKLVVQLQQAPSGK